MLAAVVTTLFFAATPVFANRAAGLLGSTRANFWRLVVAALLLGGWAHLAGEGFAGPAVGWFVLGGVVGFGIGGLAMFESLPRLGSTLSNLIVQCVAAVVAAMVEWLWLGTRLTPLEIACGTLTLAGVAIGLRPQSLPRFAPRQWVGGLAWAFLSAAGQGVGAVLSRKAFAVSASVHVVIDPGTAAYQRAIGGLVVAALALLLVARRGAEPIRDGRSAPPWVLANALTGPVLGVTCYQWALQTTAAGIVQPIVAAAPLLTIPLAARLEHQRPRPWYYVGAVLAVVGVTGLLLR
ncbi:MAG TPA: EamA family transporter [Opitutaceae bacterium]|nr:EamA family transporter [Opitutaceae bacterium]